MSIGNKLKHPAILRLKVPERTVDYSAPQYVEVLPSGVKTYIPQEETTTLSFTRLLAVGTLPPLFAVLVGTYLVGGWPSAADSPEVSSEKKRVIAASLVTGIAVGTVTSLVAKIFPE